MSDTPEFDTTGTDEAVCPWCGYKERDSLDLFNGYTHVDTLTHTCPGCNARYYLSSTVKVVFTTSKTP